MDRSPPAHDLSGRRTHWLIEFAQSLVLLALTYALVVMTTGGRHVIAMPGWVRALLVMAAAGATATLRTWRHYRRDSRPPLGSISGVSRHAGRRVR